jgi:hypothetical protein
MAARTIPASPLGLPPRHDSSPMEAVGLSKGASPPTPNLLSQVLGKKSTREVLHALHDLTHFGLCELEMLLQQFNRLRANAGHKINKASTPLLGGRSGQLACPHAQLGIPETSSRADSGTPPAASRPLHSHTHSLGEDKQSML